MTKLRAFQLFAGLFICIVITACRPQIVVTVTATPEPDLAPTPHDTRPDETHVDFLSDVRVRQAIAHCTDRTALIRAVYPWMADPALVAAESVVPRGHWAFAGDQSGFPRYAFDPDRGRALLEAAGWTLSDESNYRTNAAGDELAFKLTTTDAAFRQTWAAVFEQQMAECGLRMVRLHAAPGWLFGAATGLQRRDFEMAAFAWIIGPLFDWQGAFACDQIPSPANDWLGMNYSGWCSDRASDAAYAAVFGLDQESRRYALEVLQWEAAADLPAIPLFQRVDVYAVNPALENFQPNPSELYSWNAAEWRAPGKDTIVIGQVREPATLLLTDESTESRLLQSLVRGLDIATLDYGLRPLTLNTLPADGYDLFRNAIRAEAGDVVVDADRRVTVLAEGTQVINMVGERQTFDGSAWLSQYVVTYRFDPNLTWADGAAVTTEDYKLAHSLTCDPETAAPELFKFHYDCQWIESIDFIDDNAYVVTWLPGYDSPAVLWPPVGRLSARRFLNDGRQLSEVPFAEWAALPELTQTPLGVGPYAVAQWLSGSEIVLEANAYYYRGRPATPRLIVRQFESAEAAIAALLNGEVDILGPETVDASAHTGALLQAQAEGRARVIVLPINVYEHVDFNLGESGPIRHHDSP